MTPLQLVSPAPLRLLEGARRPAWLRVAVVAIGLAGLGCTSSSETKAPPVADAGGGIPLGASCDPAAAQTCEVLTDACSASLCDPTSHLCMRVAVDGGPTCGNGIPPTPNCASEASYDCDAGESDASPEAGDAGALGDAGDSASADAAGDALSDAPGDAQGDAIPDAPSDALDGETEAFDGGAD